MLENLGRERLSLYFHMRDFLHSEIGNFHGRPNIPDEPDLAIKAGKRLCEELLDPIVETFGPIAVRSSYRSSELNHFGATEVKPQKCSSNAANHARHIWDRLDRNDHMGATACIAIPWFADQLDSDGNHRDWRDLAWWLHDHLNYSEMWFFPKLVAFNLSWSEAPLRTISSYAAPKGKLLAAGTEPGEPEESRKARYADFPAFRGIHFPETSK